MRMNNMSAAECVLFAGYVLGKKSLRNPETSSGVSTTQPFHELQCLFCRA